jgi:hypothetical protein
MQKTPEEVRALDEAAYVITCVVDRTPSRLDAARRKKAIDRFKLGADVADYLGAETLHLASYAPPVRYVSARPYSLGDKGGYAFADRTLVRIPRGPTGKSRKTLMRSARRAHARPCHRSFSWARVSKSSAPDRCRDRHVERLFQAFHGPSAGASVSR